MYFSMKDDDYEVFFRVNLGKQFEFDNRKYDSVRQCFIDHAIGLQYFNPVEVPLYHKTMYTKYTGICYKLDEHKGVMFADTGLSWKQAYICVCANLFAMYFKQCFNSFEDVTARKFSSAFLACEALRSQFEIDFEYGEVLELRSYEFINRDGNLLIDCGYTDRMSFDIDVDSFRAVVMTDETISNLCSCNRGFLNKLKGMNLGYYRTSSKYDNVIFALDVAGLTFKPLTKFPIITDTIVIKQQASGYRQSIDWNNAFMVV